MISALVGYWEAVRAGQPAPEAGMDEAFVRGHIELRELGAPALLVLSSDAPDARRPKELGEVVVAYPRMTTSQVAPKFLWGKAEYLLGAHRAVVPASKTAVDKHDAFLRLVVDVEAATLHRGLRHLLDWYAAGARFANDDAEVNPADELYFTVDGEPLHLSPALQAHYLRPQGMYETEVASGELGVSAATGDSGVMMRGNVVKVRGLSAAAQSTLASTNDSCLYSYGHTSPPITARDLDFAHKAINYLLTQPSHHLRLEEEVWLWWGGGVEDGLAALDDPLLAAALATAAAAPFVGKAADLELFREDVAHVAVLTSDIARIVVKGYRHGPPKLLLASVLDWLSFIEIFPPVPSGSARGDLHSLSAIAAACLPRTSVARDAKARRRAVSSLYEAVVLQSGVVPLALVSAALSRNSILGGPFVDAPSRAVKRRFSLPRLALLKAAYVSRLVDPSDRESAAMKLRSLNTENKQPGYVLGRFLAHVESVQRSALGSVGLSVADRYYSSMSRRPASVIGLVIDLHRAHLRKLRSLKPRFARYCEGVTGEILALLDPAEPHLTQLDLHQQILFPIGFYHQAVPKKAPPTIVPVADEAPVPDSVETSAP